jgi:hypothetical protein
VFARFVTYAGFLGGACWCEVSFLFFHLSFRMEFCCKVLKQCVLENQIDRSSQERTFHLLERKTFSLLLDNLYDTPTTPRFPRNPTLKIPIPATNHASRFLRSRRRRDIKESRVPIPLRIKPPPASRVPSLLLLNSTAMSDLAKYSVLGSGLDSFQTMNTTRRRRKRRRRTRRKTSPTRATVRIIPQ